LQGRQQGRQRIHDDRGRLLLDWNTGLSTSGSGVPRCRLSG
jgi:hypothetical protein